MYFKTILVFFTLFIINPSGDSETKSHFHQTTNQKEVNNPALYNIPIGYYLNSEERFQKELILSTENKVILDNGSDIIKE